MNKKSVTGIRNLLTKHNLTLVEVLKTFHRGDSINFSDWFSTESQAVLTVIVGFYIWFQLRSITSIQESVDFSFVDEWHDFLTTWMTSTEVTGVINVIVKNYITWEWDLRFWAIISWNFFLLRYIKWILSNLFINIFETIFRRPKNLNNFILLFYIDHIRKLIVDNLLS